jgi:hypothetical protein
MTILNGISDTALTLLVPGYVRRIYKENNDSHITLTLEQARLVWEALNEVFDKEKSL